MNIALLSSNYNVRRLNIADMTSLSIQNTGIGSCIIDELCQYMKKPGITGLRLGWAKGNLHAEHFWHKNGFSGNRDYI